MLLSIDSRLEFQSAEAMDYLLQIELAQTEGQHFDEHEIILPTGLEHSRIEGQDAVGERVWLKAEGKVSVRYRAKVTIDRPSADLNALVSVPSSDLPADIVPYLFDSRYCLTDKFTSFVESEFEAQSGGRRLTAIRDWIANNFTYDPASSNAETNAVDSFVERRGVCRDYAHVLISFARASGIPARYIACYAPDVTPQDFHAVAQVFLRDPETGEDAWHLVDATGMSTPAATAIIGVGRDAADVSFLTSFGVSEFLGCTVQVQRDE